MVSTKFLLVETSDTEVHKKKDFETSNTEVPLKTVNLNLSNPPYK